MRDRKGCPSPSVRIIGVTEDVAGDMCSKGRHHVRLLRDECAIAAGDVAPRAESRRRCRRADRGRERGQHARSRCALSNHADAGSAGSRDVDVPGVFDDCLVARRGRPAARVLRHYAVVAFLVAQRTPEFGIRMALGATVRQIASAMMNETLRVALIGLGAGLALAMAVVRALSAASEIVLRFGHVLCRRCADCPCRHDGRGAIAILACVAHRSVEGAESRISEGTTEQPRGDGAAVRRLRCENLVVRHDTTTRTSKPQRTFTSIGQNLNTVAQRPIVVRASY